MLTTAQRSEFDQRGFVRLRGAFSRDEAAAMEDHLWRALERKFGARRDRPDSWQFPLSKGLQPQRTHSIFDPIAGPTLRGALDDLIGAGQWQEPKHWGSFLVSFPIGNEDPRLHRAMWHTDFPYFLPPDRVVGALVFVFIGEVPPRAGGTLVIAGSPRVVGRFIGERPHLRKLKMKVTRQALMSSDPWLKSVGSGSGEEDWVGRVVASADEIADIPVEVVELCGEPGDIVVCHPWMLHSGSPNRSDRPRFMRVQRIRSAE